MEPEKVHSTRRFWTIAGGTVAALLISFGIPGIPMADAACNIVGTAAPNIIICGGANDTVTALGGDDTVSSGGGNDTVFSGTGDDTVNLGTGNDVGFGGECTGPPAVVLACLADGTSDTINGGDGKDTIAGGDGVDNLNGEVGADKVWGEDGNDVLSGGGGADLVSGGPGNDAVTGGSGGDTLADGLGTDTVLAGGGDDFVFVKNDAVADTINCGSGFDVVSEFLPGNTYIGCEKESELFSGDDEGPAPP